MKIPKRGGTYHNALGRVLGEDNDIHARESNLRALDNLTDFLGILHHLLGGVKARHWVLENAAPNGIVRARDISVA